MRLILDGMGGDNAPLEIVKGAVEASSKIDHQIVIAGREDEINAELAKYNYDESKIQVVHTSEVIENEDSPVKAIRRKTDSSMVKGLTMLKDGESDLFISAGNTGAYMAGSLLILGRIPGVDRPAIASIYPIAGGALPSIIVDAGANSECRPSNLLEFAIMGSLYMEKVMDRKNASVGLVNLGIEENKGTTVTKAAHKLLKEADINFIGNVEARDVPKGACDVIVCDGFTGNIILKLTEGFAWNLLKTMKKKFTDGISAKMGAVLLAGKVKEIKDEFDYSEYGGAPILGVNGHVLKIHGSSGSAAVKNAIIKGIPYAQENVVGRITSAMEGVDVEE